MNPKITEPGISRRRGTSAFFHLDPISCGRSFNGWKAGFGASSMTPKWAKSSSSSLPSPQTQAEGNPLAMQLLLFGKYTMSWYVIHDHILLVFLVYIFLFNLIKSQFSNFPWHLIWPYSLRKSAWNHHVPIPMFQYSVSFWMISPTI